MQPDIRIDTQSTGVSAWRPMIGVVNGGEGAGHGQACLRQKLIFFPFDLFSHYLRCLQLAEAIRDDFDIFVASSHESKTNQLIVEHGFQVVQCKTIDAARMSLMESQLDHSWLNEDELEPVFLDQVRVLRELRPFLVISDFSITLSMAAEYALVTCYALTIAHLSQHSSMKRKAPEWHPGVRILKNLHCPKPVVHWVTRIGMQIEFRKMHKGIRKLRKKYMLQSRHDYLDELEGNYNLITDIEDFSPMKRLPGNYTYVGPVYHQPSGAEEDLLAKLSPDKPTVLVSFGTFWSSDELYALFNDPLFRDYNVVVAGSPKIAMHPSIIQKGFINLEAVLPRSDLLFCHGGDATVYQGLSHAVPILGLPFHGEQTWSLQRVEQLGFGETVGQSVTSQELVETIQFWLKKKRKEKIRFDLFSEKISLRSTQWRFREALVGLNQRTFCDFCRRGTLESSEEVVNVPSDVRRYQKQFFRMWRCAACRSLHSVRMLDVSTYYEDYPYDRVGNTIFVELAWRNLVKIIRTYGVTSTSRILFSGALSAVAHEVFRRCGLPHFDVLPQPTHLAEPWRFPAEKKYDFIILIDCLERMDEPAHFLQAVRDALTPDGRALIHSPDAAHVDLRRLGYYVHELHQPYRLHLLSKSVLLRLAKCSGLELVSYQRRHFWDTKYPFVNQRRIHSMDHCTDGSVDATVSLSDMKFTRWWNLPRMVAAGLLGGFFPKGSTMLTVFERSRQRVSE